MNRLRQNLLASLTDSEFPVRKIVLCYQGNRALAEAIAGLLPYSCLLVHSPSQLLTGPELAEVSHALELYQPAGPGYEGCLAQRAALRTQGCRILTLYDWEENYLADAFWGDVEYPALASLLAQTKAELERVEEFSITSELGTDIRFSVKGRRWLAEDGMCRSQALTQLPDGEIYTCPVEETLTGVLVVDGTVSRSWLPDEPQHLEFVQGRLVNCSPAMAAYLAPKAPDIYQIGEFALGFNTACRQVVRNISVDEKAAGTVHFALGDSYGLGRSKSRYHVDMVIRRPKIRTWPAIQLPYFMAD